MDAGGLTSLGIGQLNPAVATEEITILGFPLIGNRGREKEEEISY
jgi:hypothetical protein